MSAEGFEIQVGRRYQSTNTQGYSCIPSHVSTDRVTFDKFDANGTKWDTGDMMHQSFRSFYAPIAPDLLKEAINVIMSVKSEIDYLPEDDLTKAEKRILLQAKAFLASVEVK